MDLAPPLQAQIDRLAEDGNCAFDSGAMASAIQQWSMALDVLPEPRVDWEAWTWLNASRGDAFYQLGNFATARQALFDALNGPGGPTNPFIHFRLGLCAQRLNLEGEAVEHLLKAYMLDGDDIFKAEPAGAVALQLLRTRGLI